MNKDADLHYHVRIEYGGMEEVSQHRSFTAAMAKARAEILVERMFDLDLPRRLRRVFRRTDFIKGVYSCWQGKPRKGDDYEIEIEVSACTSGLHAA